MQINLIDIADELVILNKVTLDRLIASERNADCLLLYLFYYRTAKWQGTNRPKATDSFVRKGLGWGQVRLANAKKALREMGLIETIRGTKGGKIEGWYVEVKYIVSSKKIAEIKGDFTRSPEVPDSTKWETDNKCLNNKDKCLKTYLDSKESKGEAPVVDVVRSQRSLDIDEAFVIWEEVMGYPLAANKTDRHAIHSILSRKEMDLEKLRMLVLLVKKSQTDRYKRFSITNYTDLMYKTNDLVAWAHEKAAQQKQESRVVEV